MNKTNTSWTQSLANLGPRFLPFADAASEDLPLSRLLRLSLFQISVGMAMVMLVGTLNRVMIVELKVSATLVSFMVALPLLIAPLRALIGFRSDNHRSQLGWRRVPYIWMGSLLQFGGFSIMPFALLVLAGAGQSSQAPAWVGQVGAAGAFLLVGLGMHTVQTAGLALATDLAPPERQPQVVGLMYVMQLIGMIGSALMLGYLLHDYSPGQLIRVVQAVAVTTLVLNVIALWKQEPRSRLRKPGTPIEHTFAQAWQLFCQGPNTVRRLLAVGLGTMAFTMEDVLLEPYGGEILHMSVSSTTLLSATLALGGLLGFAWASRVLGRGGDAYRMSGWGAWIGLPAFVASLARPPGHLPRCLCWASF
jgi:MFS transporter, BCD family, chlorophyll transporter